MKSRTALVRCVCRRSQRNATARAVSIFTPGCRRAVRSAPRWQRPCGDCGCADAGSASGLPVPSCVAPATPSGSPIRRGRRSPHRAARRYFYPRPVLFHPALDGGFITFHRPAFGLLRREPEPATAARDDPRESSLRTAARSVRRHVDRSTDPSRSPLHEHLSASADAPVPIVL